ncbi:hypothetical protein [Rhizobium sp. AN95]|uniref:hypothetical protein n=1 Tax=Rhizobium sp. AN95 TaxID=3035216 RepID=UPI002B25EBCD|nr:hypothetical protein [Rhizobium sp. AN95]
MAEQHNSGIVAFIDRLAEMGRLYSKDLGFLVLTGEGTIARFPKAEMFAEFRATCNPGERQLSAEKRILHIEQQGCEATAVLYRRMSDRASSTSYELRLRRVDRDWQVLGKTVLPWPETHNCQGVPCAARALKERGILHPRVA